MHPDSPTSLLVIANRSLTREAVVLVFAQSGCSCDACALDPADLVRGYALLPQVAILLADGDAPHIAATIGRLRESAPAGSSEVPLVCLAGAVDPVDARRALDLGACGYVTLADGMAALGDAVAHAVDGAIFVGSSVGVALARESDALTCAGLSARESDLLRLLALGFTNAEAAHELNYSVRTVEAVRAGFCHRLGIASRRELVQVAIDLGLLHSVAS